MGMDISVYDEDGLRKIYFKGSFDEDLNIEKILQEIKPNMVFNMKDINKITSFGVKLWIDLLKHIPDSYEIKFENCSIPFVDQANMISNFVQKGKISSYYAPFICENGHEFEFLLNIEDVKFVDDEFEIPDVKCKECGADCELDEFAEDYFGFLELDSE